jgi:hypothetical protein
MNSNQQEISSKLAAVIPKLKTDKGVRSLTGGEISILRYPQVPVRYVMHQAASYGVMVTALVLVGAGLGNDAGIPNVERPRGHQDTLRNYRRFPNIVST